MDASTAEIITSWSDLVSLVLVGLNFLAGGLDPQFPAWGWNRAAVVRLLVAILASFAWTVFRFVIEGVYKTPGPREFLAANVIYLARWLYLWILMLRRSQPEYRMRRIVLELRNVLMMRSGSGKDRTHDDPDRQSGNFHEIVLRRGVADIPKGLKEYWRGYNHKCVFHERECVWETHILEKHLHQEELDPIGTSKYLSANDDLLNDVYKRVYDVVLKAVSSRAPFPEEMAMLRSPEMPGPRPATPATPVAAPPPGYPTATPVLTHPPPHVFIPVGTGNIAEATGQSSNVRQEPGKQLVPQNNERPPPVEVDFALFLRKWKGLPVERIAEIRGTVDARPIGRVARKIAADALVFIKHEGAEFRTAQQVKVLNQCLINAAHAQFEGGLEYVPEGYAPKEDIAIEDGMEEHV